MPVAAANGPSTSMFNRIDTDRSGTISSSEMRGMLQRARVSPMVVGEATDALMEALDANQNGQVATDEFKANIGGVLFMFVQTREGQEPSPAQMPRATDDWFTKTDTSRDNKVTQAELKAELLEAMEREGKSFPEMRSDAGARMGIYLLDDNADGSVARAELASLVADLYPA